MYSISSSSPKYTFQIEHGEDTLLLSLAFLRVSVLYMYNSAFQVHIYMYILKIYSHYLVMYSSILQYNTIQYNPCRLYFAVCPPAVYTYAQPTMQPCSQLSKRNINKNKNKSIVSFVRPNQITIQNSARVLSYNHHHHHHHHRLHHRLLRPSLLL